MKETHCPICFGELEVREVAPCWECGWDPAEMEHLREGKHSYAEFLILGERIVLCDFCMVDFSSYKPSYFGRGREFRPGLGKDMQFVQDLENATAGWDKYCASCRHRLAFLRFLSKVRERA